MTNVDANGPKSWTLIAYDAANKKNVSAEIAVNFYCKKSTVAMTNSFLIRLFLVNVNLLQSRVIVTETGSFIQHLSPAATLQLTKCELSFENTTLNLSTSRSTTTEVCFFSLGQTGAWHCLVAGRQPYFEKIIQFRER